MIDYGKVDAEELQDQIDRRRSLGPDGRVSGIWRLIGLYHPEFNPDPEGDPYGVFNRWQTSYKPAQALKCEMCDERPVLTAHCSWSGSIEGGDGSETSVDVKYWIECKCGQRQEFCAEHFIRWPKGSKTSYHTAIQLIGEWNRSLRRKIKKRYI